MGMGDAVDLEKLLGKRLNGVILRMRNKDSRHRPRSQLFLCFDDDTYFEFMCHDDHIFPTSGPMPFDFHRALSYMKESSDQDIVAWRAPPLDQEEEETPRRRWDD